MRLVIDLFSALRSKLTSPATRSFAVTPDDDDSLPWVPRALHVGTGGNLVLRLRDDETDRTFKVQSGTLLPCRPTHIREAGTTAADIVGLF